MVITSMEKNSSSPVHAPGSVIQMAPAVALESLKSPNGGGVQVIRGDDSDPPTFLSPIGAGGGIKTDPIHLSDALKEESMSTDELSKFCFPSEAARSDQSAENRVPAASGTDCSSGSSTSSWGSTKEMNAKVVSRDTSRQGRETQRWVADPNTQQMIRLVTGCVPILKDGRILFVSSRRKPQWILPKGGWEADEAIEESAIRETYEEAGLLGTLGPRLAETSYETRKAKKRRLEHAETKRRQSGSDPVPDSTQSPEDNQHLPQHANSGSTGSSPEQINCPQKATLSDTEVARIRASKTPNCDETSSVASDGSATYSTARLTLFPLYVSEVKDSWPESGRGRKAVSIDEAIEMMQYRPEFQAALIEVKEKGLHIVDQPAAETLQRSEAS